jgi:uncharacterized membrane protein
VSGRTRLLLIASLALNLFLAGLIGGALLLDRKPGTEPHHEPPPGRRSFWAAAEQLQPAQRDAFRAVLRREAEEGRPRLQALRQARRDAAAAMSAPDYEPAAVREALARARTEELALRSDVEEAVVAFAATLEPQDRAVLGQALRRRPGGLRRDTGPRPEGQAKGQPREEGGAQERR